jgi:hypothetical protein
MSFSIIVVIFISLAVRVDGAMKVQDIDMLGDVLPPEKVFKRIIPIDPAAFTGNVGIILPPGKGLVREFVMREMIYYQSHYYAPAHIVITLYSRADDLYKVLNNTHEDVNNPGCSMVDMVDIGHLDGDGAQCGRNGFRMWYAITPMQWEEFHVWSDIIIKLTTGGHDIFLLTYPLDPHGQVAALPDEQTSILYDSVSGKGTTICYRYSDRGCNKTIPYCDNLQADVRNACGDHGNCTKTLDNERYECKCEDGYKMAGEHCASTLCFDGLELVNNTCMDIDECVTNPCANGMTCVNSYGGFKCRQNCPGGYLLDTVTMECEDIDECVDVKPFPCPINNMTCGNTYGSFECHQNCPVGYLLYTATMECEDVDECADVKTCPNMVCVNSLGSFGCRQKCPVGYLLNSVTSECDDVDECVDVKTCPNMTCVNSFGSFACQQRICPDGYLLNNITMECEDVDECAEGTDACDTATTRCVNVAGGSRCECKDTCKNGLDQSGTTCSPHVFEYRLLDPDKARCCSHTPDMTAFLVRARVIPGVTGDTNRYSDIEPVGCLHLSKHNPALFKHAVAKPYEVKGDALLEEETILGYVRYVNARLNEKIPAGDPMAMNAVFYYSSGCSQTYSTGIAAGPSKTTDTIYVVRTEPTHKYYDPRRTLSRRCVTLPTNTAGLDTLLARPIPQEIAKTQCQTGNSAAAATNELINSVAAMITVMMSKILVGLM